MWRILMKWKKESHKENCPSITKTSKAQNQNNGKNIPLWNIFKTNRPLPLSMRPTIKLSSLQPAAPESLSRQMQCQQHHHLHSKSPHHQHHFHIIIWVWRQHESICYIPLRHHCWQNTLTNHQCLLQKIRCFFRHLIPSTKMMSLCSNRKANS